jgi:hypothetical protein
VIEGTLGELDTRDQLGNHKIGVRITLAVGLGGQIDGHASRGLCKIRTMVEIEAPNKILIRFAGAALLCHDHAGTVSRTSLVRISGRASS